MKTILQYLQYIFKSALVPISIFIYYSCLNTSAQTSSFTVDFDYDCAPTIVTLTNNSSTGPGIEYLWDFGKGAIIPSDDEVLYEAYTQPGYYTITLAVVEGSDTVRSSQEIFIATGPEAAFTAEATQGCAPHTVTFTDNSTEGDAAITEVFWDFRDGQTRIGQTIAYTYTQAGTNNVFMRVTDGNGCSAYTEIPDLVTIYQTPIVNFSASDSFACEAPLSVNFMNLSDGTGELQSFWNYGDGNTSTNFTGSNLFTEDGNYDVSLRITDENNCTDSLVKESFINIGSESGDLYVLINEQPVFNPNTLLCQGNLTFGSTLPKQADYHWIVDYNGTILHFFNEEEITISAIDSGYIDLTLQYGQATQCPGSLNKRFRIDYVLADFAMDKDYACSYPVDVVLSNTSENYTEITWYLPDGSTNEQDTLTTIIDRDHPTYEEIYNHKVNFWNIPIILIATNDNGCQDTLIRNLEIVLPVARTMPDITSGCVPFEVEFSDSSRSKEPIVEWQLFVDDQIITHITKDPFYYTFENPGDYDVMLAITNDLGCRDTSYVVTIHAGEILTPTLSIDPTTICFGNTISLNSDDPPADLVDTWQYASPGLFNTGTLSSPNTSVSVYPSSGGLKDISLTIESNYCVSDTTYKDILIVESPTGYFDFQFSCDSPLVYKFVSHFENSDNLLWTIGTDEFVGIDSFLYEFPGTGDFEVTLNATNSISGCSVIKTRTIKVRDVKAAFAVRPIICAGVETEFNATTSIDYINECFIEGFLWNFDDETPPRRNYNPIHYHTYYEEGLYNPWVVVTADNDCVDTLETLVKVVRPPADFSVDPESGCGPHMEANFSIDSLVATLSNWVWLFGDNSTDETNNPNPTHYYHSFYDNEFTAFLIVTDIYGCQNYSNQVIKVSVPNATFQAIDPGLCLGQAAEFVLSDPELDSLVWDYGDGSPLGISNTHLYSDTGIYSVSLSVIKNGCNNSLTRYGYISVEQADATYTVSDSLPDCYPATITFNHIGSTGAVASGTWTYSPGVHSSTYDPVTEYTYTEPGIYLTSLTIQTGNNCIASESKIIEVSGPQVDFVFSPATICNGDTVSFNMIQSDELDEFEWIFGDGNVSNELSPRHVYFGDGTLFPALRVVKDDCEVTISNQSLRILNPDASFVILNETDNQCVDAPLNTRNESSLFSQSLWSIDGIVVSNTTHLQDYYFHQLGEHTISLIIYNSIGCSDSTSQTINIVSLPEFQIYGDTSICPGTESAQLQVDGQPGWSISWQPSDYLNNASIFNPLAHPPATTDFFAMIVDENFCRDTQSITVHVKEIPNIQRRPVSDTSIIIGESIQLYIQSDIENTTYSWSPFHSISCLSCQDPVVNPTQDFTYTVIVKDECFELSYDFFIEVIINYYLELPKAFTPNGDGENDIFHFEANHVNAVDFKIFNRWGNMVFSTQDLNQGWDGRYNGKLQNPDTYTYYIHAVSDHGFEFEKKGTFLLLR